MSSHDYQNINGEPLDIARIEAAKPLKPKPSKPRTVRVRSGEQATLSRGWEVTGIDPASVAEAKAQADREGRHFDALTFIRNKARRKKMRPTPYELHVAAQQCADMARRQGWLDVRIEEVLARSVVQDAGLL